MGTTGSREPLRVAVIGCGAIAQRYHGPVLAGHPDVTVAAVVDPNVEARRAFASAYGVAAEHADVASLLGAGRGSIDAALVASPPFAHAEQTIALLEAGVSVMVEKPMAIELADAERMVATAEAGGVVLAVSMFRRLLPGFAQLRRLVEAGALGAVRRVSLRSGGAFDWELQSLAAFDPRRSGGGVLMDMGPHYVDLLLTLLGGERAEVLRCRDDRQGGAESNCELELRIAGVPVTMSLSRERTLTGGLVVDCDRGRLRFDLGLSSPVCVEPPETGAGGQAEAKGGERSDLARLCELAGGAVKLDADEEATGPLLFYRQLDAWVGAVRGEGRPTVTGAEGLASQRAIHEAQDRVEPEVPWWRGVPWVEAGATDEAGDGIAGEADGLTALTPGSLAGQTVLVTGASGFIGGRVCEVLAAMPEVRVRAMVRTPKSAVRLSRLNVEMVRADLTDRAAVAEAMRGVDRVIHTAVGVETFDPASVRRVTVDGTANLVGEAERQRVQRLVHLSTIAVYPNDRVETIDETYPTGDRGGELYARTKLAAERRVAGAAARGLPVAILRPGCVYGPFGKTFALRPMLGMLTGRFLLAENPHAPSNTVFVDHLVDAILLALLSPEPAGGEPMNVTDEDGCSWMSFYGGLQRRVGGEIETNDAPLVEPTPPPWALRLVGDLRAAAIGGPMKTYLKTLYRLDALGAPVRGLLGRAPMLERSARYLIADRSPEVFHPPAGEGDARPGPEVVLGPCHARVVSGRIRERLGWRPRYDLDHRLDATAAWFRWRFAEEIPSLKAPGPDDVSSRPGGRAAVNAGASG